MKTSTLIVLILIGHTALYAQGSPSEYHKPELKKNVVYGTFGTIVALGAIYGDYERNFFRNQSRSLSLWIKVGYGFYYHYSQDYYPLTNFRTAFTMVTGKNHKHFEMSLGYMFFHGKATNWYGPFELIYSNPSITGSIGYRHQKRDGNFIFRFGAGYPESIYLSFGYCFGK